MDDNDRSVPIVTRSVTRTEQQLYENKQEVNSHIITAAKQIAIGLLASTNKKN